MSYPFSVPSGTPVTKVGLDKTIDWGRVLLSKVKKEAEDSHHCHGLIVPPQTEFKVIHELARDRYQCIIRESELSLNVFEKMMGGVCNG